MCVRTHHSAWAETKFWSSFLLVVPSSRQEGRARTVKGDDIRANLPPSDVSFLAIA
jgi:hypothetical protein